MPPSTRSKRILSYRQQRANEICLVTPFRSATSVNTAVGGKGGLADIPVGQWAQLAIVQPGLTSCARELIQLLAAVPQLDLASAAWDNVPSRVAKCAASIGRERQEAQLTLGWWIEESDAGMVAETDWGAAWRFTDVEGWAALWGAVSSCAVLRQNQALLYWTTAATERRRAGALVPSSYLSTIIEQSSISSDARVQALTVLMDPGEAARYSYPAGSDPSPHYLDHEIRFTVKEFDPRFLKQTLLTIRRFCEFFDAGIAGGTVVLPWGFRSARELEAFSLFGERAECGELLGLAEGNHPTPTVCDLLFADTFAIRFYGTDVDITLALRPDALLMTR